MDPLAVGGYPGEWIDVRALRRFASFSGGYVRAAATPRRYRSLTAPLTDQAYRLGAPIIGPSIIAASSGPASIPLTIVDDFPLPAAHRLTATWERLDNTIGELGRDDTLQVPGSDTTTAVALSVVRWPHITVTRSGEARPTSRGFDFQLPTPERSGHYRVSLGLVPAGARTERPVRTLPAVEVRVDPPFAGAVAATAPTDTQVGATVTVGITVANVGTLDWGPTPADDAARLRRVEILPRRPAVLTVAWRSPTGQDVAAGDIELPLAPGATARLDLDIVAPPTAGSWELELDVVHPAHGSLAAAGLVPRPTTIDVEPPSSANAR
jgi:hypothetical protein